MKILALVPARGGSKRLPGKNIRLLGDKPLIAWSIAAAKGIPEICDILVSTDDSAIAKIGREVGALVPWLRPEELGTDTASSVDVAIHALDWYEAAKGAVDGLLLLQPTSPFRTRETISKAIALFEKDDGRYPLLGVSSASCHPAWCFRLDGQCMQPFIGWENDKTRSQDLEPAYMLNGALYLISPQMLRKTLSFLTADSRPLVMDNSIECIDIDTELDWRVATEALVLEESKDAGEH